MPKTSSTQVSQLSSEARYMVIGAALAHQNALIVGKKGGGKTAMLKYMPMQIFGKGRFLLMECSPSMTDAQISGYSNPLYKLTPDADAQGIERWVTEGTPIDPQYLAVTFDELTRASTVGLDSIIHKIHDEYMGHRPTYFATANWMDVDRRTDPIFDRFALINHFVETDIDIKAVARNAEVSGWEFDLPTYEQVMQVREWTNAYMSLSGKDFDNHPASKAIVKVLEEIARLFASEKELEFNMRRIKQWKKILYSCSCYFNGMTDQWDNIPADVFEIMKFAYPSKERAEQNRWQSVVNGLYNPDGSAIEEYMQNAYANFLDVVKAAGGKEALKNNKDLVISQLGSQFQDASEEMSSMFGGNTPEVVAAKKALQKLMQKALRGEDL